MARGLDSIPWFTGLQILVKLGKDTGRFLEKGQKCVGSQHPVLVKVWRLLSEAASVAL